ncbi:MAG: hypothetical protein LBT44_04920 [Clostridiales bacterium]|nr:hypothetical protein [Clostridiales bacterium]
MEPNRVILINGDSSEWYEQAIFIVKKNIPDCKMPMDFVLEAEKVINQYLAHKVRGSRTNAAQAVSADLNALKGAQARRPKRRRFNVFLNIILLVGCLTLMTVLYLHR